MDRPRALHLSPEFERHRRYLSAKSREFHRTLEVLRKTRESECLENSECKMTNGTCQMTNGTCQMTNGTCQMTNGRCQMADDKERTADDSGQIARDEMGDSLKSPFRK